MLPPFGETAPSKHICTQSTNCSNQKYHVRISNASRFVRNEAHIIILTSNFQTVEAYIENITVNFFDQLKCAKSAQYFNLSDNPTHRRFKQRGRPHDVINSQETQLSAKKTKKGNVYTLYYYFILSCYYLSLFFCINFII